MTRQRTIVVLLAVFCVLLGLNLTRGVTATPAPPAEAGIGGTCPSDVNGDSVINVLDLIDLLLDFGEECPGPQLVDMTRVQGPCGGNLIVRVWSDGFADYRLSPYVPFGQEPTEWTPLPANPNAPVSSRPVAVSGGLDRFFRQWADGTVDDIHFVCGGTPTTISPDRFGWNTQPD